MKITLLDTYTGITLSAPFIDASLFWWANGNGSCDCNRALLFDDEVDAALEETYGENICYGYKRFIAVDVHGDLEGLSKHEVLSKINDGYDL